MSSRFIVRPADVNDALGICTVHVRSWQTTYVGIVEQSYLDKLEIEPRVPGVIKRIQEAVIKYFVLVESDSQNIVGFVLLGPNREKNVDADGEMYAIYLLKEYQGLGGGKLLYQVASEAIQKMGLKKMMVSVLEDNISSRRFYEAMGAKLIGADHVDLEERRYLTSTYLWIY